MLVCRGNQCKLLITIFVFDLVVNSNSFLSNLCLIKEGLLLECQ